MTPPAAAGKAIRQYNRLLIQTPQGEGYIYLDDLRDLIAGDLWGWIEVVDRDRALVGRAEIASDNQRFYIAMGRVRYWLWMRKVAGLISGRIEAAPLAVRGPVSTAPAMIREIAGRARA